MPFDVLPTVIFVKSNVEFLVWKAAFNNLQLEDLPSDASVD
jgi:hypothetical protein